MAYSTHTMPRKPIKKKGVVHVKGYEINFNTVITTLIGAGTWLMLSYGVRWVGDTNKKVTEIIHDFPGMKKDIVSIKKEQDRFKTQYAPPIK
jgi:hypothetical protein